MSGRIGALWLCGVAASTAGAAERLAAPASHPLPISRVAPSVALTPASLELADRPHHPAAPTGAFLSSYLAPQMSRRLAPLGEWFATASRDRGQLVDAGGVQVRENAEQLAWKATRKAVRSWLGDRFEPEFTIGAGLPSRATSTRGGTKVSFGIASLRPRMLVERAAGAGAVRFGVNAAGDLHLEWRPDAGETRLGASYDASSRRVGLDFVGRF